MICHNKIQKCTCFIKKKPHSTYTVFSIYNIVDNQLAQVYLICIYYITLVK